MSAQAATVLVGTALTQESDRIVTAAARLARALGGTVHLAHAVPYPVELFDDTVLSDRVLTDLREQERKALAQQVAEQAERLGIGAGLLHGITVDPVEPHRSLIRLARTLHPRLIVVGAAEESGRVTRAFGSTAGRVIRKATHPVLVVRGALAVPPRRLLFPVDLSPLASHAARAAATLLAHLDGEGPTHVEALYVLSERDRRLLAASTGGDEDPAAGALHRLESFAAEYLATLAGGGDRLTCSLRVGEPSDEILARCAEEPPDLVVVGTHGRSGFERLLIGSVTDDVVRGAPSSVLVIPAGSSVVVEHSA